MVSTITSNSQSLQVFLVSSNSQCEFEEICKVLDGSSLEHFHDEAELVYGIKFWIDSSVTVNIRELERSFGCSIFVLDQVQLKLLKDPAVPKVAVFDLDSTLIQMEVIDELAAALPAIRDKVAQITADSMAGLIDFKEALKQRVNLLKGLAIEPEWERIRKEVRFTSGVKRLFSSCLCLPNGWHTAIVSGGFLPIANWVREQLKIEAVYANQLEVDSSTGNLTGNLQEGCELVDSSAKEAHLKALIQKHDAAISLAVGDGANDLLMLHSASVGVAFNAKAIVQDRAQFRLNHPSLLSLSFILQ